MLAMWAWLGAMCLQIALLGRQLHCVVLLADLETDIQNPHDWAREMNRFRNAEYVGQTLLAALLLLSGCWLSGLANALLAAFVLARLRGRGEDRCEPADAFRDAPLHRRNRFGLLACHSVLFALVMFRLVEAAILEMLRHHHHEHAGGGAGGEEGGGAEAARRLTRELLREAAASVHGY